MYVRISFHWQPFMFAPSSNSTPAPSEETMEADGNNSSGNLFASPGTVQLYIMCRHYEVLT